MDGITIRLVLSGIAEECNSNSFSRISAVDEEIHNHSSAPYGKPFPKKYT
jgi:hypothetical protein